jgi:hypothetical protein
MFQRIADQVVLSFFSLLYSGAVRLLRLRTSDRLQPAGGFSPPLGSGTEVPRRLKPAPPTQR